MFTFVGMDNALRLPVIHLTIIVVITLAKMIDCSSFSAKSYLVVYFSKGEILETRKKLISKTLTK